MKVTVICYGTAKEWNSVKEAKDFYLEGIMETEGAERDRYINIYADLNAGLKIAWDHVKLPEGFVVKGGVVQMTRKAVRS